MKPRRITILRKGLLVLALILAVGMSWSHLYRRWSGQATVDEVDGEK